MLNEVQAKGLLVQWLEAKLHSLNNSWGLNYISGLTVHEEEAE